MDYSIFENILPALGNLMSGEHILFLIIGVIIGLAVGLLPGLGGVAGMSLIIPFIYGLDPGSALAMMIGLTSVTTTSDTFPSVLLGIPGSSGSQATVMDGFPLTKKGQAARALSAAFAASLFGGVFGAIVLTGAIFVARPLILAIGFGEQLMLILLALTLVGMLTGGSAIKGLAACGTGLLLGTVGAATATAEYRMTFDLLYLSDGIPLMIVGLGIFAIPEMLGVLTANRNLSESGLIKDGWLKGLKDVLKHRWIMIRCASIGSLIGALPGLGGTVIDWIAYGHVVQTSREKEEFGKGDIRGVIAPESANNAKEGGALIPTLLFGIPGSGSMALLLGGLVLIGITPGRSMVEENVDLTFLIIWSIALANIIGAAVCIGLARPVARLTTVRYTLIAPFMIVMIFFASFQASRDWGDLLALLGVGAFGMLMKRYGWSRPAFLIGFVLSEQLEAAFYRTIQVYGFDFLTRPISLILLVLCGLSAALAWRNMQMIQARSKSQQKTAKDVVSKSIRRQHISMASSLLAIALIIIVDVADLRFLSNAFPITVATITGGFLLLFIFRLLAKEPQSSLFDGINENDANSGRGAIYYFAWLGGIIALSAVFGFTIAAPLFVFVFLRYLGGAGILMAAISAASISGLLYMMQYLLVLEYPRGLLQSLMS